MQIDTRSGQVTVKNRLVYLDGELAAEIIKGKNIFNPSTGWRIIKRGAFVTGTGGDIELDCATQREAVLCMFHFRRCQVPTGV